MLKGIHPLLGPDLLHAIATMGHGDEIVIADGNFPASTMGPPVIRADGVGAVTSVAGGATAAAGSADGATAATGTAVASAVGVAL